MPCDPYEWFDPETGRQGTMAPPQPSARFESVTRWPTPPADTPEPQFEPKMPWTFGDTIRRAAASHHPELANLLQAIAGAADKGLVVQDAKHVLRENFQVGRVMDLSSDQQLAAIKLFNEWRPK